MDRSDPDTAATVAPQTLTRHLSAVRWWHRQAGLVSPTDHPQLADTIAGIRRTEGTDTRRARPIYLEDLAAMVAEADDGPKGLRDRALLCVGWWGAFRRSELVAITTADVADDPQGVVITLPRSKTDQEGKGRQVPLHYHRGDTCPVVNLRRWSVSADSDKKGPVFRSVDRWGNVNGVGLDGRAVSQVVKEYAVAVGLDPAAYSGHSLRAGFVSECDRRGIASSAVRVVTGHQTEAMLSVYTRPRSLFESSAGGRSSTTNRAGRFQRHVPQTESRTHLEVTLRYPVSEDRTWQAFYFLPESFRLDATTYSKRELFADFRSYVRFTIPRIELERVPEEAQKLAERLMSGPPDDVVQELKLFGSRVRLAITDEAQAIIDAEVDRGADAGGSIRNQRFDVRDRHRGRSWSVRGRAKAC